MVYEDLSLAELKALFQDLANQVVALSEQRRQVFALIEKREAEAAMSVRVMNEVQKDALRHVLEVPAVEGPLPVSAAK